MGYRSGMQEAVFLFPAQSVYQCTLGVLNRLHFRVKSSDPYHGNIRATAPPVSLFRYSGVSINIHTRNFKKVNIRIDCYYTPLGLPIRLPSRGLNEEAMVLLDEIRKELDAADVKG